MTTNYYAVTDEDKRHWEGVHLAQTAGGWKPTIQWHWEPSGCSCHCNVHHYRNYDEFKEYVRSGYVIKDEFENVINVEEFLDKLENFQKENRRDDYYESRGSRVWMINGWNFRSGDWC